MTQFEKFKFMSENGDANAQYFLAQMYELGHEIEQDKEEAQRWYKLSADQGYIPAQEKMFLKSLTSDIEV